MYIRVHTNRVELADDMGYFVRSEYFTANIHDKSTGPVVIPTNFDKEGFEPKM